MAHRGLGGWHAAHAEHFGEERWEELHHALHRDADHLLVLNPFLPPEERAAISGEYSLVPTGVPGAYAFEVPEDPSAQYRIAEYPDEHTIFVESEREGLLPFFFLEGAAAIVALALGAEEGDEVLDARAAPGGKALILAAEMFARGWGEGRSMRGKLVCNEVSKEQAAKLQRAARRHLPPELFEEDVGRGPHVVFTASDMRTSSNSHERHGPYDRILLDAPCTNDRHLLRGTAAATLEQWSRGTLKVSAERQAKWLYNSLWLLKEGGVVLFCSTALAPEECDHVVEAVVRKAHGSFVLEILPLEEHILRMVPSLAAEPSDWGVRLMPDKSEYGPMFFSRIRMARRTHAAVEHLKW